MCSRYVCQTNLNTQCIVKNSGNHGSDYTATWIGPVTPGKATVKEADKEQGKDDDNDWKDIPNTAKGEINETKTESKVIDIKNKNISNFLERNFEYKVIAANVDYNEDSDDQDSNDQDSNGVKESSDYKKETTNQDYTEDSLEEDVGESDGWEDVPDDLEYIEAKQNQFDNFKLGHRKQKLKRK